MRALRLSERSAVRTLKEGGVLDRGFDEDAAVVGFRRQGNFTLALVVDRSRGRSYVGAAKRTRRSADRPYAGARLAFIRALLGIPLEEEQPAPAICDPFVLPAGELPPAA